MFLYCDINEEGVIIASISGRYIIPERKYDDYFILTEEEYGEEPDVIIDYLYKYVVIDRILQKIMPDEPLIKNEENNDGMLADAEKEEYS